ncbi:MAG: nucleoside-diphosphate kinase [Candidatus Hadarchaeales archaeon]
MEWTCLIVKPDGVMRGLVEEVKRRIEKSGLKIVKEKRMRLTREKAEALYEVHRGKDFFGPLINFMISGDIVAMIVEGENAIQIVRQLVGPTNPSNAPKGTIRGDFGTSTRENVVHASESPESARYEISLLFPENPKL